LAGLFLSKAKVWLLDEPFTALDPIGIDIVEKSISKHCKQGGICVFTTHQDSTLPNQKVVDIMNIYMQTLKRDLRHCDSQPFQCAQPAVIFC
jgi:ABC-type transport system involved in cytochrome c biogenesis, ATPase component